MRLGDGVEPDREDRARQAVDGEGGVVPTSPRAEQGRSPSEEGGKSERSDCYISERSAYYIVGAPLAFYIFLARPPASLRKWVEQNQAELERKLQGQYGGASGPNLLELVFTLPSTNLPSPASRGRTRHPRPLLHLYSSVVTTFRPW